MKRNFFWLDLNSFDISFLLTCVMTLRLRHSIFCSEIFCICQFDLGSLLCRNCEMVRFLEEFSADTVHSLSRMLHKDVGEGVKETGLLQIKYQ